MEGNSGQSVNVRGNWVMEGKAVNGPSFLWMGGRPLWRDDEYVMDGKEGQWWGDKNVVLGYSAIGRLSSILVCIGVGRK